MAMSFCSKLGKFLINEDMPDGLKKMSMIIFPLIFSSMDRIDVVSNAMELRGFGKHKKRTWYKGRKLTKTDYMTLAFAAVFMIASLWITFADGNRFYNPFSR